MMAQISKAAVILVLASMLAFPASAAGDASASARNFVQGFYDWYVPASQDIKDMHPTEMAIKAKAGAFGAPLLDALRKDLAAKDKVQGEMVGLDFDPFLNSQDPYAHYEAGAVHARNGRYWVDVFGVQGGKRNSAPDVTAELVNKNGSWVFVNFQYSKTDNLASILKQLAATQN